MGLNSSQIQIFHMADELYDDRMASFGLVQLKNLNGKIINEVSIIISQSLAEASLIFSNLGRSGILMFNHGFSSQ